MSRETRNMKDYFNLSMSFSALIRKSSEPVGSFVGHLNSLGLLLLHCGFDEDAERFAIFSGKMIEKFGEESTQAMPHDLFKHYHSLTSHAWDSVVRELPNQSCVLLKSTPVIHSLHAFKLANLVLGTILEEELIILDETIQCLETGSYRAATVLGWSLAFEHVRRWIFHDRVRKQRFNDVLTARNRSKTATHEPISIFEDFYEHTDRFIVDIAYDAKLFNKHTHQVLLNALTDRNHFAHPSGRDATTATASGYIETLIINILNKLKVKIRVKKK